jgi:hypothetical protein
MFLSLQIRLGPSGIEEYFLPLPAMNDAEKAGTEALKAEPKAASRRAQSLPQ